MRFAGWRTRAAVTDLAKIIHSLLCAAGKLRRWGRAFRKRRHSGRQVVNHPMHPGAARRIRIVGNKRGAFGISGRVVPGQRRRNVQSGAGIFVRYRLAVGECRTDDLKGQGGFLCGFGMVRATGSNHTTEPCRGQPEIHARVHAPSLARAHSLFKRIVSA